jgi:hypothetical protein
MVKGGFMKKYIVLIGLFLFATTVEAKQKGFMETLNAGKKQESVSMEEIQTRKRMQIERLKERYNKKYENLSKEELEKHKKRLEQTLKFAEQDNNPIFQAELEVVNSLLKEKK